MPEHRIRLRAAWERLELGQPAPIRIDLPTVWSPDQTHAPFTLRRVFGCPPIDLAREAVELEIHDAPGLMAVRLNGQPLGIPYLQSDSVSLPLADLLLRRNMVEIDVAGLVRTDRPWGGIALRIVTR